MQILMRYNLVNICHIDDSDIVSFVLSDLLTFLKIFKTNYTLSDEGRGINSLYLWQKCFQFSVNFYVTTFQWILTYMNQYNTSQAYN